MKNISLALSVLVSLSLLSACGTQEDAKKSADDLIRDQQKQIGGNGEKQEMNERQFASYCERKNGELRTNASVCSYIRKKFDLNDKTGPAGKTYKQVVLELGSWVVDLGGIAHGSLLSASLKGTQPVTFVINGAVLMTIRDGVPIVKQPTGAGKLTIRIDYGEYDYFNALVRQCDDRTGTSVPCDPRE
jgi:hypothetical protein